MTNILIVSNHYPVCSARFATAAFERLGHTVRHVGPAMGTNIWGMTLPPWSVWEPDSPTNKEDDYLSPSVSWPDLIVVMDSDPKILDMQGVKAIGPHKHNCPTVVWGVDNHVRDYRRDWFDHYFLAHRRGSVMEWRPKLMQPPTVGVNIGTAKNNDMTHLPCCYDPTLHTPSPIPFEDREYDVCMIGVMYPQRQALVNGLRKAGLKVLAGTGLIGDAYVGAYHNSRIALNISVAGDAAQRLFETAAMGCVVMTDPVEDLAILKPNGFWLLTAWKSLFETEQVNYVIRDVKDILADPDTATAMIEQSMDWAKGRTWDTRAATILSWAGLVSRSTTTKYRWA